MHGSGALIRWLLDNDLVDEMTLFTFPVIVGQGTRLFPDTGPDRALDLIETRATPSGVTIQVYRVHLRLPGLASTLAPLPSSTHPPSRSAPRAPTRPLRRLLNEETALFARTFGCVRNVAVARPVLVMGVRQWGPPRLAN